MLQVKPNPSTNHVAKECPLEIFGGSEDGNPAIHECVGSCSLDHVCAKHPEHSSGKAGLEV
jgi:hypothetical protein